MPANQGGTADFYPSLTIVRDGYFIFKRGDNMAGKKHIQYQDNRRWRFSREVYTKQFWRDDYDKTSYFRAFARAAFKF